MAVYAAVFRTYWFLIAAVTAGLIVFAYRRRLSARRYLIRLFGLSQVFLVIFCLAAPLVLGRSANTFRSDLNANREGALDAVTVISPFVAGDSPVMSYINAVFTQVSLLIPWPLLMKGSQYVLYAVGIFAVWMTLLVTGGSQGARRINQSVSACASDFATAGVQVLHRAAEVEADTALFEQRM